MSHLALESPSAEDSGAETQDRYLWQHHVTAIDCLSMLTNPDVHRVVCEIHEDYIVERDGILELVSCKHREQTQGPWSLIALCSDGGIAHLFCRWADFQSVRARLMTNAALKTGQGEALAVSDACEALKLNGTIDEDISASRDNLVDALLAAAGGNNRFPNIPQTPKPPRRKADRGDPPPGFPNLVERFMQALSIRQLLPGRQHIHAHHVENVAKPAIETSSASLDHAAACYEAVLKLIANRNTATPLSREYAKWFTQRPRGAVAAFVQARTIYPDDVADLVQDAVSRHRALTITPAARLQAKLKAGKIRVNRRSAALSAREQWLADWRSARTDLPGDRATYLALEASILEVAGDLEAKLDPNSDDFGDQFYEQLRTQLQSGNFKSPATLPLVDRNFFGLAMDLAAKCRIWFSDEFDVEAEILQHPYSPVTAQVSHE